jgi:predicted homoserine dehydrogenase-like protein
MSLHRLLQERVTAGRPVRVGLIGAGKFGTTFLAQVPTTPGLHVLGVADLDPQRGRDAMARTGWDLGAAGATSFADALARGTTHVTDDAMGLIAADGLEVVIDATGSPAAGLAFARACVREGRHLIMVNVEADVLAGPLLAREFRRAGLVCTAAYGDQPALICELVDWARTCGFDVVAAGKGTKYLPEYHESTPETVWEHWGLTPEQAEAAGMNPKMFNSFLDGTKSSIEMTAVANATGLTAPPGGLAFPPAGVDDLARVLRPPSDGGVLHHKGQVEVVSSLERDGTPVPRHLRWGVYVVLEAPSEYTARCFGEYGLSTDPSGRYSAVHRPHHLIGLELNVSVLTAALRGEATGMATGFCADTVAVAKRSLAPGETLDGEGGTTVWGRIMPADDSLSLGALPIGLAHDARLTRAVSAGEVVTRADVNLDEDDPTVRTRGEMERAFAREAIGPG